LRETLIDRLYAKSGREREEDGNPAAKEKQMKAQVSDGRSSKAENTYGYFFSYP
jgi:hypothetical protein